MLRTAALLGLLALTTLVARPVAAERAVDPLTGVLERVSALHRLGRHPVVVFDIDDTLVRVGPRKKRILQDWAAREPAVSPELRARIQALDPFRLPYSTNRLIAQLGITEPKLRKSVMAAWKKGFYRGEYAVHDTPVPGAVGFVNDVRKAGGLVVYLTARDRKPMEQGTIRELALLGFPVPGHGVVLMMREIPTMPVRYKKVAIVRISRMGTIVALFDNEPSGVNLFHRALPGAVVGYLDTVHSEDAPPLLPGLTILRDFRR